MSTADSQLLVTASAITEDFYKAKIRPNASDKELMMVSRLTVMGVSIIAILIALNPNNTVLGLVENAWAGFGATFGPVMLFALFWKRSNKYGAIAGMLSGGIMIFLWKYVVRPLGGALDIYELLPAFMVACIFIVVVSLLTPAPEKEIVEEFESVKTAQV